MTSEFKEAWQRVDPESKAKILYRSAVHEAGHAVAVWYLDQVRYWAGTSPCRTFTMWRSAWRAGVSGAYEGRATMQVVS